MTIFELDIDSQFNFYFPKCKNNNFVIEEKERFYKCENCGFVNEMGD